jgi:hypothetical protein
MIRTNSKKAGLLAGWGLNEGVCREQGEDWLTNWLVPDGRPFCNDSLN